MKAVPLQALMCMLMLAVAQTAAAADDFKIIKLEQDVRNLERQVRELSRQIAELRRDASWSPGPVPPGATRDMETTTDSPPWLEAKNWQRLQPGMTELQVIETLGPPTSMRSDVEADARTLFYALEIGTGNFLSGSVQLRDRRVVEISTPVLK